MKVHRHLLLLFSVAVGFGQIARQTATEAEVGREKSVFGRHLQDGEEFNKGCRNDAKQKRICHHQGSVTVE